MKYIPARVLSFSAEIVLIDGIRSRLHSRGARDHYPPLRRDTRIRIDETEAIQDEYFREEDDGASRAGSLVVEAVLRQPE